MDITGNGATFVNDTVARGTPAFRLVGNAIRFTNRSTIDSLALISASPTSFAIDMIGTGGTIINTAAGTIGTRGTVAIRGSSGSDTIENAGVLAGRIDLGDGADTIITTSGMLIDADIALGAGDDRFIAQLRTGPGSNIGGAGGLLTGGTGFDTFVLDRVAAKLWFWDISGFERFEFVGDDSGASTRLRIPAGAVEQIDVRGARLNIIESAIFEAAATISGGWLVLGGEGQGSQRTVIGSVTGGAGNDILEIGWGYIRATVELGGGNDIYRLSDVRADVRAVNGGDGDDFFDLRRVENDFQVYDGGAGNDTLSFAGYTEAIFILLDGPGGGPQGQSLGKSNFENVIGAGLGDTLRGSAVANRINGLAGNDSLYGLAGDDTIEGGDGDDYIEASSGDDRVLAGAGNDYVTYVLQDAGGGLGDDRIEGEAGNDRLVDDIGTNFIDGGAGNDSIFGAGELRGGDGDDEINALDFANRALGITVVSISSGGAGNDLIRTSFGVDIANGGDGDDAIQVGLTDATNIDTVDGGAGVDTLSLYEANSVAGIYADLAAMWGGGIGRYGLVGAAATGTLAGFETLSLTFASDFADAITIGAGYTSALYIDLKAGNDTLFAGSGADRLFGRDGNDEIRASAGDDEVEGNAGADLVLAGDGNDRVFGGDGNDRLFGDAGDDDLWGDIGADEIGGGSGTDNIQGGEGNDSIGGDAGNDGLRGDAGNDSLDGGDGDDNLSGGDGNDRVRGGGGADFVYGDAGRDSVEGGAGNDVLNGGAGQDVVTGGDGNDQLQDLAAFSGGTGGDSLAGGLGDDNYLVDDQTTLIFEIAGEGRDQVIAGSSYYLYANLEVLFLEDRAGDAFGVGNDLGNILIGNTGANLLIGGALRDNINGNAGADALFGLGGGDDLQGGAGIDYLVGGDGDDGLIGGTQADALYGEAGSDILFAGDDFVTDILVGGDGNDFLHGDSGLGDYDLLDGGAGNDLYWVDTPADLTFEASGGGTDTIRANIIGAGYYLYANTENLILEGNTPFGVGNELANELTGNAAGNYLLGGLGSDRLNGKGGNDVLFGEGGGDFFEFERGTGGDVIGDFTPGTDAIRLIDFGFTSFAQLQSAFVEVAGTTAINLGHGDLIVINNVTNAALSATDFTLG